MFLKILFTLFIYPRRVGTSSRGPDLIHEGDNLCHTLTWSLQVLYQVRLYPTFMKFSLLALVVGLAAPCVAFVPQNGPRLVPRTGHDFEATIMKDLEIDAVDFDDLLDNSAIPSDSSINAVRPHIFNSSTSISALYLI